MYIEPNTVIKILHNVPLDNTYEHTIYFEDEALRQVYFNTKVKYTLNKQSYQRLQRGFMRVDIQAENLYDCNYLMYQNTAFGSKWFYAFIKGVEYINNAVSQIEFEIDVMQTWHEDYTLDGCFVEREHSASDGLYENIIEEDINIGDEYVQINSNDKQTFNMNVMNVCALVNRNVAGQSQSPAGVTINNIYTPMRIINGNAVQTPAFVDTALDAYQEGDIIGVYQYPAVFEDNANTGRITYYDKTITAPTTTLAGGYTPHNKKLFSYPYCKLLVSNNAGTVAEYRWEDWDSDNRGKFKIGGVAVSIPEAICYPFHYRNIDYNYDEGVIMTNFPQCAWSGDMFKAWWAQHQWSYSVSAMESARAAGNSVVNPTIQSMQAGTPASLVGGLMGVGMGIGNVVGSVLSTIGGMKDIKNTPSQTYGHTQTQTLNTGAGRIQYDFYKVCIKPQYLEIIDSFFDRFGYATKKTKIPNRNVRPHWTYTKTIACTISGSVPADDMAKICSIYDNGITFWKYGSEVGNYTLDNRANPV